MIPVSFQNFANKSDYHRPVDIKKLKFIYFTTIRKSLEISKKITDLNILEVGCGKGNILLPLAYLGSNIVGFDIGSDSISETNRKIKLNNYINVNAFEDNAYTFDLKTKFDLIIVSEVFEHLKSPEILIRQLLSHSHSKTTILVTIPNGFGPWEYKQSLLEPFRAIKRNNIIRNFFGKKKYEVIEGVAHVQFYSLLEFVNLFDKSNLFCRNIYKSDSLLSFFLHDYPPSRTLGDFLTTKDITLADRLPYWLASGWYFNFEMKK